MLQKRIVVCLDVRDGKTTKGVKFKNNVDIGDPVDMAAEYYRQGVDELVFYDITASAEKRGIMIDVVRRVAETIFIPFSVGGGIASLDNISAVIMAGAEKVSVNSAAVRNPDIITAGAHKYGSQCVVVAVDIEADSSMPSGYGVVIDGGRLKSGRDMLAWCKEVENRGAGEIVLNSIDADGTQDGYDIRATRLVSRTLSIPVVASGGAGQPEHLFKVFTEGCADAALVASMLHYRGYTIGDIKRAIASSGLFIRMDW